MARGNPPAKARAPRRDPTASINLSSLAGEYEPVPVPAPRLLWQNNPDPLFRDFAPKPGPLALFRRRR